MAFGTWPSPITLDEAVASDVSLRELGSDGENLYWLESTPGEDARLTLVRWRDGRIEELTPAPCSVRTRVHEYGGGSWGAAGGAVVWCDQTAGQVMGRVDDGEAVALTPASDMYRYAALLPCAGQQHCVLAVREDHSAHGEAVTTLVALPWPSAGAEPSVGMPLASGADFYADPAWDGQGRLAWIEWDHPSMPWDATRLVVADLVGDGAQGLESLRVESPRIVAGGTARPENGVSVQHPRWMPDGSLLFMSDESGWWNLHCWWPAADRVEAVVTEPFDGDQAMWQVGRRSFAVLDDDVYYELRDQGVCWLAQMSLTDGDTRRIARFSAVDGLTVCKNQLYALVKRPSGPPAVVRISERQDHAARRGEGSSAVSHGWATSTVRCPASDPDPAVTPKADSLTFEGRHGQVQAWFFPPHNADFQGPEGELPPAILTVHSGPTGTATDEYSSQVAFWTSRGYAVLAVNYAGSAGFGRAYRERLRGQWGIVDVDDCLDGARMLGLRGLADPRRIVIMGGSAGGFTVLACLTRSDVFAAGVSRYGIGDLVALQDGGHKFEAHYNDGLIGPWPQAREVFEERSPINHLDQLATPILIMQGAEDPVVPPDQAESMADAVRERGLPVALVLFEGEGHGFRKPSTRRRVLECELSFFAQLFGIPADDDLPTLHVENLRS